ncbi:MAG TPA: acyl-CoA dehydrogenase family protein [Nitrososphaeraceae archaeon]|nr:acyl-CoA dehydrogenase family protein [Nitrososphaeraceae archaeon]
MNFDITKKQEDFISKVDGVCKSLRSIEEECYIEDRLNEKLVPEFSKIGMLGCPISKKYGGLGFDILTYCKSLERIGEEGNSMRTFFSVHTSIGQMVLQGWADEDQKKRYLPETTSGKSIMAFALTEPEAGSDPSSMNSRYEDKGEYLLLTGKKHWIGNGTIADIVTTYAKDRTTGKISAFIVDMNSSGIRKKEMKNKMGLLTIKNAEIDFEECCVPKQNLLGELGLGLNIAYSALIDGRLSVAAGCIGVMNDCLNETLNHAKLRRQHGSVLAKKQLIQQHISRIIVGKESVKWLTYKAACARQKLHDYVEEFKLEQEDWQKKLDRNNIAYSKLRKEADRLTTIAKFHATNTAFDCANRSVQVFGSFGYQKTARVAKHFLDSRATMIYEGANEVLELKIASEVLGDAYKAY